MNIDITLTQEELDFIDALMKTGRYSSTDEIFHESLKMLQAADNALAMLRADLEESFGGKEKVDDFIASFK
jgi:putative addiction module CopG family antidote